MKPKSGAIWIYTETQKTYIIQEVGEMKIGSGEWIESVTYRCTDSARVFTRDMETFLKKFERRIPTVEGAQLPGLGFR